MGSYSILHPKYVFGLNGGCHSTNVHFLDGNTIMYPAGNAVIMYNMEQKTQSFLHGVEKAKGITALAVSALKTHAAVAQLGEKPSVGIFDLKTNKRKKTLVYPETTATEYVSLSFTLEGSNLVALTGNPEYLIVLWKWEKGKLICQAKATGNLGPVYEISTSPVELNVLCAIGRASFRFIRLGEGLMKPFGFSKGENYHFMCHAWLGIGDKLIAGTNNGKLMYFERGEYRSDIRLPSISEVNGSGSGKNLETKSNSVVNLSNAPSAEGDQGAHTVHDFKGISAIVVYSKGFAIGYGPGYVIVYEEQLTYESPEDHFKPLYVIRVPFHSADTHDQIIRAIAVNSTEETLVVTTANSQILYFSLPSAEFKDPNELYLEYVISPFHFGAVIALDVALRKSLFVTLGADRYIRVWNYVTMTLEASKEFHEDIFCISIHPTGLFLITGSIDKIRIFSIVMDDIREVHEFHARACKECVFSNGGHLFALANGNIIQLYSTTTFENVGNMKGHSSKIRRLKWSSNDSVLVSVGADGAIYRWDIINMRREAEYVERGCDMLDVGISPDGKTFYAIAANKFVKEIQIQDGVLLKEINMELNPKCLTLSRSGKTLVSGLDDGVVRSLRQPLSRANEWLDFRIHLEVINAIRITVDESYVITVSEDGTIVMWRITDVDGRTSKLEKEIVYATEVLITKADLDERNASMRELKQKFGELRLEMDYQMKRKEMSYLEETKGITSNFNNQIDELNTKINELVEAKQEHDTNYHAFVEEMATEQKQTVENIKAHFNARLIAEFEKYNELQKLLEETITTYETSIQSLDGDSQNAVEELVDYFEGKIKDKTSELDDAYEEARNTLTESEEMKKQIEEDADTEILNLTFMYEKKLKREQAVNNKLRTESNVMKRNFAAMNREIENRHAEVVKLQHEGDKMKSTIMMSEKEVQSLRKDLVDRDVNVMGKEKVIYDLKKTNGELEKYKFVLDYNIKELKKMIQPKEREIIYLKQQNVDMEQELSTTLAVRNGLELQVNELANKLRVADYEYQAEKQLRSRFEALIRNIRSYMSHCMNLLQDHKALVVALKTMYAKFGHTIEVSKASNQDQETICELVRQKNYLELCLTSLKKKMAKEVDLTRNEQLKIMNENMLLVFEINNLRRELKLTRDRAQAYEVCLGILPTNTGNAKTLELRMRLHAAIEDKTAITIKHDQEMHDKQNIIDSITNEIDHLNDMLLRAQEASGRKHDFTKEDVLLELA